VPYYANRAPQQFQLEMKIAKKLSKLKRCIICATLVMKVQAYDAYVYNFVETKNHKNYISRKLVI
jgi:hypothetical protein